MSVNAGEFLEGPAGHVAINLSEPVIISHIAMDHASPSLLSEDDISSAPKNVALWALLPLTDNAEYEPRMPVRSLDDFKFMKYSKDELPLLSRLWQITHFQYNIFKQPTRQIFPVPRLFPTQTIILEIKSNEGSDTTCIYWLGIFGVR